MASTFKRKSDQGRPGSRWVINYFDAEQGKRRTIRGYSDRGASLAKGDRLERESARRAEGLINVVDEQARRPIGEHLAEYLGTLRARGRESRYVQQVEQKIEFLAPRTGARRAIELDGAKILNVLAEYRFRSGKSNPAKSLSVAAKNEYIGAAKSFTKWCAENRRLPHDPLVSLKKLKSHSGVRAHPRRALSVDEMSRLLDAALRRPLVELQTIRTGRCRGQLGAKIRPGVAEMADATGRERRLAYLTALWTGLRRSELAELRWGDIHLDSATPHIRLRAEATKAKRGDTIAVHPELAEELRGWRPATAKPEHLVFKSVPSMRVLRADLKFAGIESGDAVTGFVDLHALRLSYGTMMAVHGVSQRSRQAQMRHSDPRLTEVTYIDARLLPVAAELQTIPAINGPRPEVPASDAEAARLSA